MSLWSYRNGKFIRAIECKTYFVYSFYVQSTMKAILCLICFCWVTFIHAQGLFQIAGKKPRSFKFELVNHVVLVPLTINGIGFTFLLDTGVKETILFANTEDSLYLNNQNKMRFYGIGIEDGIDGILSTGNVVTVGNVAVDSLHWLYVIQAHELDISSNVGVSINGILGSKFFNSFPLKIDYIKSRITVYPPSHNYEKAVRGYEKLPLEIENDRPYIQAAIQLGNRWVNGKMLMDMGNTDAFMLFPFLLPDFYVNEPYVEEYIGRGFNGAIYGKRNRARRAAIQGFELDYPIVAYPDSNAVFMTKLASQRIGSVGNQALQRFHLLLDYGSKEIYVKKNKWFKKPFLLNMAGMDVKHDGMIWSREIITAQRPKPEREGLVGADQGVTINLNNSNMQYKFVLRPSYKVVGLRKNSPAENASVKVGDTLLKINGVNAGSLSLPKLLGKLQTHPDDEIRLLLRRGEEEVHVRFLLVDPIPYR